MRATGRGKQVFGLKPTLHAVARPWVRAKRQRAMHTWWARTQRAGTASHTARGLIKASDTDFCLSQRTSNDVWWANA